MHLYKSSYKLRRQKFIAAFFAVVMIFQLLLYLFIKIKIIPLFAIITICIIFRRNKHIHLINIFISTYVCSVFVVFCINNKEINIFKFLGCTLKKQVDERIEYFFNEQNTILLGIMSSSKLFKNKCLQFKMLSMKEVTKSYKEKRLSSFINIDDTKAFDLSCLILENNEMVCVNGKIIQFKDYEKNHFKFTILELRKKQELLRKHQIQSNEVILFSIRIPPYESFWCEYKKLTEKTQMAHYIASSIGLKKTCLLASYKYLLFYANKDGYITFKQKNTLRIIVT